MLLPSQHDVGLALAAKHFVITIHNPAFVIATIFRASHFYTAARQRRARARDSGRLADLGCTHCVLIICIRAGLHNSN